MGIVCFHSSVDLPPNTTTTTFLKGEGSKFWLPPLEGGETKKLKRGGGKYGAGAGLLKRGAGTFSIVFNFFKVYQFYI